LDSADGNRSSSGIKSSRILQELPEEPAKLPMVTDVLQMFSPAATQQVQEEGASPDAAPPGDMGNWTRAAIALQDPQRTLLQVELARSSRSSLQLQASSRSALGSVQQTWNKDPAPGHMPPNFWKCHDIRRECMAAVTPHERFYTL
jgi:hypothetical protein